MRCSKCQYISFDNGDRCRNCGYEFSLSEADEDVLDLPIRTDEPSGPLADLSLADRDPRLDAPTPPARQAPPPPNPRREDSSRATASGELPLFRGRGRDDDAPLVKLPAVPRAPVAVRKSTVVPRPPEAQRPEFEELELDLDPADDFDEEEDEDTGEQFEDEEDDEPPARRAVPVHRADSAPAAEHAEVAPLLPRIFAAIIDLGLLIGMDALVLRLTLRICGLQWADTAAIPVVPFGAFIVLLNGGYVAAFTAVGGQTIGKMLAGIRVVTSEDDAWTDRVRVGASALRALGYLLSALPAGLGFLPVLIGSERRGVHDRLAHTRVVKA